MQLRAYFSIPELTPELTPDRNEPDSENVAPWADDDSHEDPLAAGRGIAMAMALAVPCWAAMGLVVYFVLRVI